VLLLFSAPSRVADAQDARYYNTEGLERYTAGDYDGAVAMFERAHSLEPENTTIRSNLARAYCAAAKESGEAKDFDAALRELDAALELESEDADFYAFAGSLYLAAGDLGSAEGMLLSALDLDPEHKDGRVLLGHVYYGRGALKDAIEQWEWVLEHHPASEDVEELVEKARRELEVEKDFVSDYKRRHFVITRDRDNFEEESRAILDILERCYYDIGKDLRCFPRNPVQVLLYSPEQFSEATLASAHVAGLYDGKIRVPLMPGNYDRDQLTLILRHEYTHVLVGELTGGNVPFWFNEGLAQYKSEELDKTKRAILADALKGGTLVPLKELDEIPFDLEKDPARVHLAYLEGFAAVTYLNRRFTRRHLLDFMYMLGQGHDTETALRTVYRRSYDQLHRDVFSEYR
jgi:hypothetical protein